MTTIILVLSLIFIIILSRKSGFTQYVKGNKYIQLIILTVLLCFIIYNGLNMKIFSFQKITGILALIILFVFGSYTFFKKYIRN